MQQAVLSCKGQGPSAVTGPAQVLTMAVQAAELRGGRRTERQLLSLAVGQGVLSSWLEKELASMKPGTLRRWRMGPGERPHFLAGHPWLSRNGLIWLEVEVLEARQPSLPDKGPRGCALISKSDIQNTRSKRLRSTDPVEALGWRSADWVAATRSTRVATTRCRLVRISQSRCRRNFADAPAPAPTPATTTSAPGHRRRPDGVHPVARPKH